MILLKETGEVVTVVNSYQMAYLVDLHVGISEELAGTFNFQLVEVCQWALCSTLAKKSGEVTGGITSIVGYLLQGESFLQILAHKMNCSRDKVFSAVGIVGMTVVFVGFSLSVESQVTHGCQVVVKKR